MKLKVALIDKNAQVPTQGTPTDRGYDVVATETTLLPFGDTKFVGTGICLEPEAGHSIELHLRSKLGGQNVVLTNSVGVVDQGYRGEVKAELAYIGTEIHPLIQGIIKQHEDDQNSEDAGDFTIFYIEYHAEYGYLELTPDEVEEIINRKEKFNQGTWLVSAGQRIAQLTGQIDVPLDITVVDSVEDLDNSERGDGGFGSTGF